MRRCRITREMFRFFGRIIFMILYHIGIKDVVIHLFPLRVSIFRHKGNMEIPENKKAPECASGAVRKQLFYFDTEHGFLLLPGCWERSQKSLDTEV